MLSISYTKNKNNDILKELESENYTNIHNVQRYIPIYNRFFELNSSNYNNVMFNQNYYLNKIISKNNLEKNSFFDENNESFDEFEFNQDIELDDNSQRSPGWIRYQKRIK